MLQIGDSEPHIFDLPQGGNGMTHRQKIDEKIHKANERQRGVKAKINAFFKKDSLSDDERSELEKRTNEHEEIDRELDALNVERRAAVAVEDDAEKRARDQFGDDPEDREKRETQEPRQFGKLPRIRAGKSKRRRRRARVRAGVRVPSGKISSAFDRPVRRASVHHGRIRTGHPANLDRSSFRRVDGDGDGSHL